MTRRFKAEDLSGPVVRVSGGEAVHAVRVLRLNIGADVVLFDGHGHEAIGRICSVGPSYFEVEVARRRDIDPELTPSAVLAVAAPKGNRADWLVEKCAELGVRALWLLRSQRAEVLPREGKLARLRRKAIQAAKQAGHATTMTIEPPRAIAEIAAAAGGGRIYYGDPNRSELTLHEALRDIPAEHRPHAAVLIFIGPEGGFTDDECAAIEQAGGRAVRLCDAILRVETAAVAAASIWAAWAAEATAQ